MEEQSKKKQKKKTYQNSFIFNDDSDKLLIYCVELSKKEHFGYQDIIWEDVRVKFLKRLESHPIQGRYVTNDTLKKRYEGYATRNRSEFTEEEQQHLMSIVQDFKSGSTIHWKDISKTQFFKERNRSGKFLQKSYNTIMSRLNKKQNGNEYFSEFCELV